MDTLLDSIHVAMGDGASADDRRRGAAACRALAEALEADPELAARPLTEVAAVPAGAAAVAPAAPSPTPAAPGPIPFAGMTADQILDLAIARLRSAVGEAATAPAAGAPFRLTLVPIPRMP